jgi:hypothetical protein
MRENKTASLSLTLNRMWILLRVINCRSICVWNGHTVFVGVQSVPRPGPPLPISCEAEVLFLA